MKPSIHHRLMFVSTLWLTGLTVGCTTAVTPFSLQDPISTDKNHGLVIGNIQLAWHEPDQPGNSDQPMKMTWTLEEETREARIVLADLPTAGPFVVKLPAGSYHVIDLRFDDR